MVPGTRLGPYEILAPIGAGGMGDVWKARDTRLNRSVAIKCLKPESADRFQHEARAIAALGHPHICQIFDVGPDYLVLEFVDGVPLQGPLSAEAARPLALQIAGALEAAHKRGILHRDLKPANVLITDNGAKLLDFGLAKMTGESDLDATQTAVNTVAGTAAYMSPEQARGRPVDARSDIFSFGALLYEVLSGRRAFAGATLLDILNAVVSSDPPPLDSALHSVVRKCLAKDPAERYQSAAELKAALVTPPATRERPSASIAVLPFANMSGDPEQEYFSDGLAEEVMNSLVKVPGLKVTARTSAFAFKGQNADVRRIADVLGVTNILEGSVRRSGNRLRVTAQLIHAADGMHLWSERYDRQMEDLFAIQDEIAAAIVGELKLRFAPGDRPRAPLNLNAHEAYLRHRQFLWGFTPESLRRSRECLEQAIALDPRYALAYVGLADHHLSQFWSGAPSDDGFACARDFAVRALELDAGSAHAHAVLGIVAGLHERNWDEARRRFRIAMSTDAVHWHVRSLYACFHLQPLGLLGEARRQMQRVLEDDPLCQISYHALGVALDGLGLEAEAESAWTRSVELDPQFAIGWMHLAMHQSAYGKHAEACESAERAYALFPTSPYVIGTLAGTLEATGESARALALLTGEPPVASRTAVSQVCYHLTSGNFDEAIRWIARAAETNFAPIASFLVRPYERFLSKSHAWPALLTELGLEPAVRD
jgi:serine/threonine-protein kinase